MIYLSSFQLSKREVRNPNIYPYNVLKGKFMDPIVFAPITIFYGNNGSGKSTLLNVIANTLHMRGKEYSSSNAFGTVDYCGAYSSECRYSLGEYEDGCRIKEVPLMCRFVKSEDILYEVKKIQQKQVLADGMIYDYVQKGMSYQAAKEFLSSKEGKKQLGFVSFAQEKYSNGETSMQIYEDILQPDGLYLLDEPEVSLSPQNQVRLSEQINYFTRLLGCQFVIATHSPFMLGTLHAKIYNIDKRECVVEEWSELENVRYFYDFFKTHEREFEE